ncbi:MAG: hypothetical protein K2J48_10340 [Muribaculaceae bacterium]|nr:hypothetical protein [Muribaculaceae bacterium]
MKTKDSIHRFSAAVMLSAAALFSVAFSSCSSDDAPNPIPDVPAEDGMATINLAFEAPTINTRANDESNPFARVYTDEDGNEFDPVDPEASETTIDNLWVYFFEVTGTNTSKLWKAFDVKTTDVATGDYSSMVKPEAISTDPTSVIYGINIPKGTYKIYVLANIAGYQSSTDKIDPTTVNTLSASDKAGLEAKLLSYTFTTQNTLNTGDKAGIIAGSLPMGAYYEDVDLSNVQGDITQNDDKTITIDSGSGTITASLTYLCAKVRYTLFFDNTVSEDGTYGYSYPIQEFDYQVIGVHNARRDAALFPAQNMADVSDEMVEKNIIDDPEDQTQGCVASVYPSANDFILWTNPNVQTSAKSLTALDKDADKPTTGQIAYQGLIYLPENQSTTDISKPNLSSATSDHRTCLHLKVKLDGELKDFVINLPEDDTTDYLKHGTFYDIVCRITSHGAEFNVKVKEWVKSSNKTSKPI